jgi:multicomponent Na+:H+ antiporter subunit E
MRQMEQRWRSVLWRVIATFFLAAILWWIFYEGEPGGLLIGGVAAGAATLASLRLLPVREWRISLPALLRFVPYFLLESGRGSVDVARRALRPRTLLKPGYLEREVSLAAGAPRLFFAGVIGLFPGTLSVELLEPEEGPARLRVHLLDTNAAAGEKLRELEQRIEPIFRRRS